MDDMKGEAYELLESCKYDLIRLAALKNSYRESYPLSIDKEMLDAMLIFEFVATNSPNKAWLDEVGMQVGINIDMVVRSYYAVRAYVTGFTLRKCEFQPQPIPQSPPKLGFFWRQTTVSLWFLCVLLGFIAFCLIMMFWMIAIIKQGR